MAITSFGGEYRFLSNFHGAEDGDTPLIIDLDGVIYPSTENAYQASKCAVLADRVQFVNCTANESKQKGRKVKLRSDWESYKFTVMFMLLQQKFSDRNPELKKALLDTRREQLVEGNYWHDNVWGSCTCAKCGNRGENRLGVMLMNIRADLHQQAFLDVGDLLIGASTIGFVGSRSCTEDQLKHLGSVAGWAACVGKKGVSGGCGGADQRAANKFVEYASAGNFHVHLPYIKYTHVAPEGCTFDVWNKLPQEVRTDALWLASQPSKFKYMTDKYPALFGRNALIVMESDVLVYAINGDSTGTNHDIAIANDIGVPTINVSDEDTWRIVRMFLRYEKDRMVEE
jgi:hypothetical protein